MSNGGGYYYTPFEVGWPAILINKIPRIGHSNDISLLASSNEDLQKDYALGVIIFACVILVFCAIWAIILIVLKCLGYRVGCAAGIPPIKPEEPHLHRHHPLHKGIEAIPTRGGSSIITGMTGFTGTVVTGLTDTPSMVAAYRDQEEWHDQLVTVEKRSRRIKISFLIFAFTVVLCSVLLIVFGLWPVNSGLNNLQKGNKEMFTKFQDGIEEIETFINFSSEAIPKTDDLLVDIVQFCPSASSSSNIGKAIVSLGSDLNAITSITTDIISLKSGLKKMQETTKKIDKTVDNFDWWMWVTVTFLIVYMILSITFIAGVVMAWKERSERGFNCVQSYILLPLFTVFVFGSILMSSIFSVLAVLDADLCSGTEFTPSPDVTFVNLLNRNEEYQNGALMYNTISYYAQGCAIRSPTAFLASFASQVTDAIYSTQNFVDVIDSSVTSNIVRTCQQDATNISNIVNAANNMKESLESLDLSISTIFDVMNCENIHPVYAEVVHESICTKGMNGIALAMVLFTLLSLSGMSMVSLRSAWYELEDFPEDLLFEYEEGDMDDEMVAYRMSPAARQHTYGVSYPGGSTETERSSSDSEDYGVSVPQPHYSSHRQHSIGYMK